MGADPIIGGSQLQRFRGGLESHRRPAGRRILLPAEAELCNAVGLSEDEYWEFVEQLERYTGERGAEYDHIPNVQNIPVSVIVNLVIGLALSAVSALLAPKPKQQEQKERPQLQTESIQGRSRFAPQQGFDSVQDLASLGAVIPLVFARRENNLGGVRVQSQLMFSQLLSRGVGQRLKLLALFSSGTVEGRPDFAGYAIGDTLLENYTEAKMSLYFKDGSLNNNRIIRTDGSKYPEATLEPGITGNFDVFAIWDDRANKTQNWFSGTRTPSTQTQFGVFSPMPNGMRYQLNWELVMVVKGSGDDTQRDADRKKKKMEHYYAYRAAITSTNPIRYTISGGQEDPNGYDPWGLEDVNSSTTSARIDADESCSMGELYMAGDVLCVCTKAPDDIWDLGLESVYEFKRLEGDLNSIQTHSVTSTTRPHDTTTIQRCAIGTITNSKSCNITEIGLKSTVWRQVTGFANVNSYPGRETHEQYEEEGGQLSLGSMTKYLKRLSFFTLEIRKAGEDDNWQDISGGKVFCVKGQTPQAQYHFIRITHPKGQYEFRFKPVAGVVAMRRYTDQNIWLMQSGNLRVQDYRADEFHVAFSGVETQLTFGLMSNPEWVLGDSKASNTKTGQVRQLSPAGTATKPPAGADVDEDGRIKIDEQYYWDTDYDDENYYVKLGRDDEELIYIYEWDGTTIGSIRMDEYPEGKVPPTLVYGNYAYKAGAEKGINRWAIQKWADASEVPGGSYGTPTFDGDVSATPAGYTAGSGLTVQLKEWSNDAAEWSIKNGGGGYKTGEIVSFIGGGKRHYAKVTVDSRQDFSDFTKNNLLPFDAINDYFKYDAENSSHKDAPEHEIVYVNEQVETSPAATYRRLAYAGLRMDSSVEWSQFNNLSAYFKRGVELERLTTTGTSASHLLPEIVYGLLTNTLWGAGKLVGKQQVDRDRMTKAAEFCEANKFFWDGVLDSKQNLREWIFTQAGYCMLDFTILGGRFSLVPSVPYGTDYKIKKGKKPEIKALFTDGNMRNMEVIFLGPEERQLFKAVCLWRQEKENGFPETRVLTARFANSYGGSDGDPEETFDMSGFCTSQTHAMRFARYALKVRREIDHSIKFETTPQAAMNLAPGEYFKVVSEASHTDRFACGSINEDGYITAVNPLADGPHTIVHWTLGTEKVDTTEIVVKNNRLVNGNIALSSVFAVVTKGVKQRVYKVETLTYAEDGLVEVTGSYAPLTEKGGLEVLNWASDQFVIETG